MTAARRQLAPTPGTTYRARLEALLWAMNRTLDPTVIGEVLRAASERQRDPAVKRTLPAKRGGR